MVEMRGGMETPAFWIQRVSQDPCSWVLQIWFAGGDRHREGATLFAPFEI
jgi:hypothetical protein